MSPEEAEALRIIRECPAALFVVQTMGTVDVDARRRIFSATLKRRNGLNAKERQAV